MRVISSPTAFSWPARLAFIVAMVFSATVLTSAATTAATRTTDASPSGAVAPIATLLTSDGSLALPAGFRGSLDARGWQLVSGADEPPRFAPADVSAPSSGLSENTGPAAPRVAGDERWAGGFGVNGVSDIAVAVAADGAGNVYVGGQFRTAGNVVVNRVAKWDGANWSALGNGVNASVNALAVDAGNNVYIGGDFTLLCADAACASGTTLNRIAKWNGSSWSALGNGLDGSVTALALNATSLYVGGSFYRECTPDCVTGPFVRYIARWDLAGSTWSALSYGLRGTVNALALDGNTLYVGGNFNSYCSSSVCSGGYMLEHIGKWNISGATWSPMGIGLDHIVYALVVHSSHMLYAGGTFTGICTTDWCGASVEANHIAKWNPSGLGSWSTLGHGVDAKIQTLAFVGPKLYAGGIFSNICTAADCGTLTPARRLAVWDPVGVAWSPVDNGVYDDISGLAPVASTLYAVGRFTQANGIVANNVVSINTGSGAHTALGTGNGLSGTTFEKVAADSAGNVYVGGYFIGAGGMRVNNIAMWSSASHTWSALGNGVDNVVLSLAVDANDDVYVGGAFQNFCTNVDCTTGTGVNRVARWNHGSATWSALGYGMESDVYALALDGTGALYAGGLFQNICTGQDCLGTSRVNYIVRWSGGNWVPLASGVNHAVTALTVDSSNRLYAGGEFDKVCPDLSCATGTVVNHVAVWDGAGTPHWSGLAKGFDGSVTALAVDGANNVYAGGDFYIACTVDDCTSGNNMNFVARWTAGGSAWTALQYGMYDGVRALVVDGSNNLYVGGFFPGPCADAGCGTFSPTGDVVRWNPSGAGSWSGLGNGTNDWVFGLARHYGDLYAVGRFTMAGNKASVHIGEYSFNAPPVISNITKSGRIGSTIPFAAADFTGVMTDPEAETLVKIKVLSLPAPAAGTLRLNSSAVTLNQEIGLADLGKLSFASNRGWTGTTSFGWNAADANGYASSSALVNLTLAGSELFLPSVQR